jgi:hypothetical protein
MARLRRHLPFWFAVWLVGHTVGAVALVPLDCCAGHQAAMTADQNCHRQPTVADEHCPMRADDGEPCPMHAETQFDCVLRGACQGPIAALAAILSQHGTLAAAFELAPDVRPMPGIPLLPRNVISLRVSPDSPPPRA